MSELGLSGLINIFGHWELGIGHWELFSQLPITHYLNNLIFKDFMVK